MLASFTDACRAAAGASRRRGCCTIVVAARPSQPSAGQPSERRLADCCPTAAIRSATAVRADGAARMIHGEATARRLCLP